MNTGIERVLIQGRNPENREQIRQTVKKILPKAEITGTDHPKQMATLIQNMTPYDIVFLDAFNQDPASMFVFENIKEISAIHQRAPHLLTKSKPVAVNHTDKWTDAITLHNSISSGIYDYISATKGDLAPQIARVIHRAQNTPPEIKNKKDAKLHFIFGHTEAAKTALTTHTTLYLPNTAIVKKGFTQQDKNPLISTNPEFSEFEKEPLKQFDKNTQIYWERNRMQAGFKIKQIYDALESGIDIILSTDSANGAETIQKELKEIPMITYLLHMEDEKSWEKLYAAHKKKNEKTKFADPNERKKLRLALINEHEKYQTTKQPGTFTFTAKIKETDTKPTTSTIHYDHSLKTTDFYTAAQEFMSLITAYRQK